MKFSEIVVPAKAGTQGVNVIARNARDTMQSLDARLRGHDDKTGFRGHDNSEELLAFLASWRFKQ